MGLLPVEFLLCYQQRGVSFERGCQWGYRIVESGEDMMW